MKHNYDHIDNNSLPAKTPEGFFQRMEIPYEKTPEDVWAKLDERINGVPSRKISAFKSYRFSLSMAAAVLLLAGTFSLLRFYTASVICPSGQHLSYILPDGSSVEMNADSKMKLRPLWWRFSRQVNFEGEGYFKVEKGNKFEVISKIGRTAVLGTSFNIYSRDHEYKVTCFTGKVKVVSFSSNEAVLGPEYEASVDADGNIAVHKDVNADETQIWISNRFNFTARPLIQVLNEIGRQFDVIITAQALPDYSYTGYFTKDRPVEEVLTLVCKPFGLTFARISEKEYEIYQN